MKINSLQPLLIDRIRDIEAKLPEEFTRQKEEYITMLLNERYVLLGGDTLIVGSEISNSNRIYDYYTLKLRLMIFTVDSDSLSSSETDDDDLEDIIGDMYREQGVSIIPYKVSFIPSHEYGRCWIYPTEYCRV